MKTAMEKILKSRKARANFEDVMSRYPDPLSNIIVSPNTKRKRDDDASGRPESGSSSSSSSSSSSRMARKLVGLNAGNIVEATGDSRRSRRSKRVKMVPSTFSQDMEDGPLQKQIMSKASNNRILLT